MTCATISEPHAYDQTENRSQNSGKSVLEPHALKNEHFPVCNSIERIIWATKFWDIKKASGQNLLKVTKLWKLQNLEEVRGRSSAEVERSETTGERSRPALWKSYN